MKLKLKSKRKLKKIVQYTRRKILINNIEFIDDNIYLPSLLEELKMCSYGFDSGILNVSKDYEDKLIKLRLAFKSCKGGLFPDKNLTEDLIQKIWSLYQ